MEFNVVAVLLMPLLVDFCSAQCFMPEMTTPPPPGSTAPTETHCHLNGIDLEPGTSHTNLTSCLKCHCETDLSLYCCGMMWYYVVPDECIVITKNCTRKVVYKSDGSPCQQLAALSRK